METDSISYQHAHLIRLIKENGFKSFLDIGCGKGEKSIFFAKELKLKVTAIDNFLGFGSNSDYDTVTNNIFERKVEHLVRLIKIDAIDAMNNRIFDQTFDVIFMQNSLHHIFPFPISLGEKVDFFFEKIYENISNRGILYICDAGRLNFWNSLFGFKKLRKIYKNSLFRTINEVNFDGKTNIGGWIYKLNKAGFKIEFISYHVPYPFRYLRPVLNNKLLNFFLESNYSILAKKQG